MLNDKSIFSAETVNSPESPESPESNKSDSITRKRFYLQPLCGIFVPLAFAAYYLWTYLVWLRPSSNPLADNNKTPPNGKYVWWSWFFIGAIGLNISDYTLGGVEAAMMMTDTFKPKTAEQVKMHRNLRWSSLRDWGTVTQDGYKAGNVPGTKVTGVNQGSMGSRFSADIINAASYLWTLDLTPQIPSGGAFYVPLNSSITTNVLKPNTLPSTAREIFLTAQAPVPITGSIWGAILKYNCSEVHRLDEFTILNQRINSSNPAYVQPAAYNDTDIAYFYTLDDGSSISVMSQLNGGFVNVAAFVEVGMSTGVSDILDRAPSLGYTSTSLGLDQEEVMELALWQTFWNPPGTFGNFTNVQDPIQELEDEHYEPQNPFGDGYPWDGNMSAIGIRCTSSSVTGTATVNGLVGTYTDFERENPSMDRFPTPRLSIGVPLMFLLLQQAAPDFVDYGYKGGLKSLGNYSVNYTVLNTKYDWITPLFMAANPDIDLDETSPRFAYYSSLIQTSELRDAFITAY
ncbi:hypothetical protein BGZ57DRAFT_858628 [Hyaloscypha finlandica]|nr:hypothetical protein BGZ57DRAFT_858628 [Hyaloscypha finlandica]